MLFRSYIEIKTYDFHCDIGNHSVTKNIIGPVNCSVCKRQGCIGHVRRYGCCDRCWGGLSDEEKVAQKKSYRKAQGTVLVIILLSFAVLFGLPFGTWLIMGTTDYLLAAFFLGLTLWLLILCKWTNIQRRKSGKSMSLWQEFRRDMKNTPNMDHKSKKIILLVCVFFAIMILIVVIIAAVIMADFNARWD